jgi:hypothetical protein
MNSNWKNHPFSHLRQLPEERQAAIMEMLETKSYCEVSRLLAAEGINAPRPALTRFRSWRLQCDQLRQNEADVDLLLEHLRTERPEIDQAELFRYGQQVLSLLAVRKENAGDWARIQRLRQQEGRLHLEAMRAKAYRRRVLLDKQALKLARDKFEFDACKAALAQLPALRKISTDKSLNAVEKLTQVRMAIFGMAPP